MGIFAKRSGPSDGRRTGPAGEERWWDPADQAFAERPVVHRSDLGKGWQSVPMMNNVERFDPYGDDPDSAVIRACRARRVLTALDEGAAWRQRRAGVLAVVRTEVFADDDPGAAEAHLAAWQEHGTDCLDAVWRERWKEHDRTPGWIEVRRRPIDDRPDIALPDPGDGSGAPAGAVDWLTVEDQTGSSESGSISFYEHVSLWRGRGLVTFTVRHEHDHDIDATVAAAAGGIVRRLQPPGR